jgi:hypothetical protein
MRGAGTVTHAQPAEMFEPRVTVPFEGAANDVARSFLRIEERNLYLMSQTANEGTDILCL